MEKKAQDESSKETFKLHVSTPRLRLSRTNSKEKLCNDQQKIKSTSSKLPRIIRMPTRYYKPIENSTKLYDDSGDSLPGPSKLETVPIKLKKEEIMIPEKPKISHIPRLKSQKDGSKENSVPLNKSRVSNTPQSNQFIPECRNVQRVNLLINPEFGSDDRDPPTSVQATRPIPTLGQIYGRMNMIDSDRLNDWFMELRTPINSIGSSNDRTPTSSAQNECNTYSSSTAYPENSHHEDLQKTSTIVLQGLDKKKNLSSQSKTTNENIDAWRSPDMEVPTRDYESGVALKPTSINSTQISKILSLNSSQKSKTMVLKKSQESQADESMAMATNQTYCVGLSLDATPKTSTPRIGVECSTGTSSILSRPTVVICGIPAPQRVEEGTFTSKSYVPLKASRLSKIDANNNTCCSNAHQPAVTPVPRVPVPSYTDCFSEVLQKTTNFENYQGIEVTKSPISGAANKEIRDKPSPIEGTKDAMEECDGDDSTTVDSLTKHSKSSDDTTFLKSDATVTEWSCQYQSDHSSDYVCRDSYGRELSKRYYVDSRHNEMRERCKKCHRYKRFPSTRYKLPRTFGTWRSGGSIRRLCYRRFNHVWKKTTERWAVWSTRSNAKSKMFRKMFVQNFVRAVVWEDVNVQTNVLVYNETGTDGVVMEQKSATMSTMCNMDTFQAMSNLTDLGSKASTKSRHLNSGPSMFPFFLNTKGKPPNLITTDRNLSSFQFPDCQQNHCTSFHYNFPWNNSAAIGISKSTKSCQYEPEIAEQIEQTTSLLKQIEFNLADQPTDTEDLPPSLADRKTSVYVPVQIPVYSSHLIQTNKDIFDVDTVSENADTEDLPNFRTDETTSTPAPPPILFSTHTIQTNQDVCNTDTVSENADTQDLPSCMTDEKTSTLAPVQAPILFSTHQIQTTQDVTNMDAITVTENADTQNLPNYMTDEKTSTLAPTQISILLSSHQIQTTQNFYNMDAVTVTQDTDLPNFMTEEKTSTPAPVPILFSSHQIQTNQDVCGMDADTQNAIVCHSADTQELPNVMTDEKTSTLAPAPTLFTTQQIQTNTETDTEGTAVAQNFIMCNNAAADLKFPIFGSSSDTMPSGSDITYYRPVAGSDITHLISESRTQQALFPILRKYYSNAASADRDREDQLVTDSATQISPGNSVETVSMGVSTSNPPVAERTTSISIDAIAVPPQVMSKEFTSVHRFNMGTQVEDFVTMPVEDLETQITPLNAVSLISEGITPSQKEDEERFMSQCVLMTTEKENLAVQTLSSRPRLAFTGTNILSISSGDLSNVTPISNTEDRSLGSDYIIGSSSKAVGSNTTMHLVPSNTTMQPVLSNAYMQPVLSNVSMQPVPSNSVTQQATSLDAASSQCFCEFNEENSTGPCQFISCGTDPTVEVFNYTRSTSARGLDSYYETEILLNKLIKKALTGSNVGSHHTNYSEKSNSSVKSRNNIIYVSTSTNTHVGLETKSIGQTASDIGKLIPSNKTDAEIQYIEQQMVKPGGDRDPIISMCMLNQPNNETPTQTEEFDKFEAIPHRSASMMTSYCGLPAAIQVPGISAMSVKKDSSRNSVAPHASSGMLALNIETNTNYQQRPVAENLAQTSLVQTQQKSLEVNIYRNCSSKPVASKDDIRNSVHNQLMSLSRLIGKKRTECSIKSQMEDKWMNEYSPVETSPQQKKFSNTFNSYNSKKAFESFIHTDEENQKRNSCAFCLQTGSNHNPTPYELPTIVLSKDSLADVLPMLNTNDIYNKKSQTELVLSPQMVDQFTSDNYVSKEVKESMLQACPEICDTETPVYGIGTESLPRTCSKKSACVLTTQCVLPPPPPCSGGKLLKPNNRGCVFVYGEPRCVVHKGCCDAATQHEPSSEKEVNQRREHVTHSVGQLTSHCSLRDGQRNPSALIREVLSPKVYKALYETTKLVVSKDKPSSIHTNVVAARVDAEVDTAKFDPPKLMSACVLTSEVMMESKSRCHCKDSQKGSHAHFKRTVQLAQKSEESHGDSSLENHDESNDECCEACMRRHLVTSCRYYSNLLTKQLDRVRQNLTRHLGAPSMDKIEQPITNSEACTMKPSGRNAFATQTLKHNPYYPSRHMSCMLSPATSLTNICKYDKAHLKSVYYMLSAIEGRLRRMKLNSPSSYCQ
ncbi:hypothetical protein PYW08_014963 [Mythimna loreyi]|uniref:Uncharacterized protein n=1 Tax=Mythimna loreyi TaxID=667449 RepID=A0ACC2R622_9NEOP|nr:hypothetical protein PYW08_014963 [Mythimna loreyi]